MDKKKRKGKLFSRRGILPVLGGGLLVPFLGTGKSENKNEPLKAKDEQYKILLKPDGTVVKVNIRALKNAKIVKKNISNKSFLGWLKRE